MNTTSRMINNSKTLPISDDRCARRLPCIAKRSFFVMSIILLFIVLGQVLAFIVLARLHPSSLHHRPIGIGIDIDIGNMSSTTLLLLLLPLPPGKRDAITAHYFESETKSVGNSKKKKNNPQHSLRRRLLDELDEEEENENYESPLSENNNNTPPPTYWPPPHDDNLQHPYFNSGPNHEDPSSSTTTSTTTTDTISSSSSSSPRTSTTTSDDTIPAVMVGVASSVILCAVFLYANDVRDRCRHERMLEQQEHQHDQQEERRRWVVPNTSSKQMETIAAGSSSGYHWGREHRLPHPPPLDDDDDDDNMDQHPHPHQPEYIEDISISPVSTMTGGTSLLRHADSEVGLDASIDITELSEAHRVSQDTDLSSLVDLSRMLSITTMAASAAIQHQQQQQSMEEEDRACIASIATLGSSSEQYVVEKDDQGMMVDYVMEDGDEDEEEDESGWTSSRSDTSSEVSIGTYLKSVHSSSKSRSGSDSICSNGASSSTSASTNCSKELLGERCLDHNDISATTTPPKRGHTSMITTIANSTMDTTDESSLDRSPDTPHGEDSLSDTINSAPRNELAQLEQLYNTNKTEQLPFQEYPCQALAEDTEEEEEEDHGDHEDDDDDSTQDYVRSIYFVPVATATTPIDLGIELQNASCPSSYPMVMTVRAESPLVDRLFVGDYILAVNNQEAVGCSASEVLTADTTFFRLQEHQQEDAKSENDEASSSDKSMGEIVKLMVMSTQADGSDSDADSSQDASIDTGRADTAVEV